MPQTVDHQRRILQAMIDAKGPAWMGSWLEGATRALYTSLLSPGDFAIDVGANRGQHALPMAQAVGAAGRVLAIEAAAEMVLGLRQAVDAAGMGAIVEIGDYAVSEAPGVATFNYIGSADGYSSLGWDDKMAEFGDRSQRTVTVQRLDDLVCDDRIAAFIKLDIEGAELPALRGAERILRRHRPVLAFENGGQRYARRFGYSAADFFGFFEQAGYGLYTPFATPFGPEWNTGMQPGQLFSLPQERAGEAAALLNPAMMEALFAAGLDR